MTTRTVAAPVAPASGRLRPLGLGEVTITGGFWGDRQRINAAATLPHIEAHLESEGWLPNFDLAATGAMAQRRRGREFADSEAYKLLEAMAWEIGRSGDPALEGRFRAIVTRIAAAQEPDGYLNTAFGRPGQPPRWSDFEWGHELYCLGHLFQAAVARQRTRPDADDGLVGVARRAADLVCAQFGAQGRQVVCGHPEVEVALAELGRALGEPRYVEQARIFVERRGHGLLADIEWGREYFQDDVPVRGATVLRGHAVRANYLAAGAVDVAVEVGDADLLDALRGQWSRSVGRRTYLTGGQGSRHQDEGFGDDWELPPDRAYSETCAGVGSIMFSWRLLLADGAPRYADLIERTLYNVVATSPSREGTAFFYANTLHRRAPGVEPDPGETSPRALSSLRAPWFSVSCCPPNVARTFASLAAYVATVDDDGLQLHQYAPAEIRTTLPDGRAVEVDIETRYPENGLVRVVVRQPAAFRLGLRVPAWADGARLRVVPVDGSSEERDVAAGVAEIERVFGQGDVVELMLPLGPRFTRPDPRIDASRGCIAVERGPEVLALESVDLSDVGIADVADAVIDVAAAPLERDGRVWVRVRRREDHEPGWPYEYSAPSSRHDAGEAALIPYRDWAERGPSTMRVWIPTD